MDDDVRRLAAWRIYPRHVTPDRFDTLWVALPAPAARVSVDRPA
jgi:hypothetical protein